MIAGNNMFIGNKNGNVLISGDGIDITNGSLYVSNDDYSIELDPNHRLKDLGDYMHGITDMRNDFLFCIRDKNVPIDEENNDIIMGIDTNGNGYFNGRIQASGGKIANFDISEDKLSTNNVEFGDSNGIYFGENGLSIGNNFKVGNDGNVFFRGNIEANSIYAVDSYKLYSNGEVIPVLMAKKDKTQTFTPIWSVMLKVNDKSYIELKESTASDYNKTKIEVLSDNIVLIGDVYTETGNITTSDRNAKENIKSLTDKHMKFFFLLEPVSFLFKDGQSGRTHIGFISQDVEYAMKRSGLTDIDFAGFCKNIKMITKTDDKGFKSEFPDLDEDGNYKYIYSLRYDEFIALNTFMIQNLYTENKQIKERLVKLEEKIDALEI